MNVNSKKKKCPKNKILNPNTNRCINIDGITYKRIFNNEIKCPKNKILNPNTNKCIKINGITYKKLFNIKKEKPIKKKDYSLQANIIKKNLKKFMHPFINRVSANIYDRKKYYKSILKNINVDLNNTNNCIQFYKLDDNNNPIFIIGDDIILKNKISNTNKNAIIYMSKFKDKYKKLFKFTIKINVYNEKNIKIIRQLTNAVLNSKCPHFPISYAILKCDNFISNLNIHDLNSFPIFIKNNKNKPLIANLYEYAYGDLKNFIIYNHDKSTNMENAFAQIYFSIIFFYKETNHFHNASHWENFLYYKIKPGGYFHYKILNKDYYIENIGYLWVINNFDDAIPFTNKSDIRIDFFKILNAFLDKYNKSKKGLSEYKYKLNFTTKIMNIFRYLFYQTIKDIPLNFTNSVDFYNYFNKFISNVLFILTKNNIINIVKPNDIINNKPFIISSFN